MGVQGEGIKSGGKWVAGEGNGIKSSGKWGAEERLTIDDFCLVYIKCLAYRWEASEGDVADSFGYFDADGSGVLSHDELRQTFTDACPFHVSDKLFDQIWRRLDADGDGEVSTNEFLH